MDRYELSDAIKLLEQMIKEQEQKMKGGMSLQLVHEGIKLTTMYQILSVFKKNHKTKKSSAATDDLE